MMDSSKASTSPDSGHQGLRGFVLPPIPNRTAHQQVFLPFLSDEMRRSSSVFFPFPLRAAGSELKKSSLSCEPFPGGRFSAFRIIMIEVFSQR